ncbi:hypothetical protein M3Y97_01163000 [Aphelenchoides bicaudatus]|nr:hypothetical protein M3Y97_01163000 [Aphelenchoides bicaudatus]
MGTVQQPIIPIKEVNETDRHRLIGMVVQRPMIWSKNVPVNKDEVKAAWEFMAQAMTTPGRGFDVTLVKKMWKNIYDSYVKIMKSDDPSKSKWQYLQPMNFLGKDFGPRKPKVEKSGSKSAKKKKVKNEPMQQQTPNSMLYYQQSPGQFQGMFGSPRSTDRPSRINSSLGASVYQPVNKDDPSTFFSHVRFELAHFVRRLIDLEQQFT